MCIIDLDGVVSDSSARSQEAEKAKQAFLEEQKLHPRIVENFSVGKEATNLYWQTAFNPELVALDTLIDGAKEALETLRYERAYELLFVTSRPESMREATEQWLFDHDIVFYTFISYHSQIALIMKESAFQFVKTVTWKTGIIQTLASLYGATDLLVIDDEDANIDEILKHMSDVKCFKSLAEAIAEPVEDETDSPF